MVSAARSHAAPPAPDLARVTPAGAFDATREGSILIAFPSSGIPSGGGTSSAFVQMAAPI